MTRFMMSLEDSVELVLFAFKNAKPGDIFVQKSPAATIETLAQALKSYSMLPMKSRLLEPDMVRKCSNLCVAKRKCLKWRI
jgi:FlaA1/EpsC-like NDP-sugar epimerase